MSVFVYGTLLSDEIVKSLLRRMPACKPAVLHGFKRMRLKDRAFPAIVPSDKDRVVGKVSKSLANIHALSGNSETMIFIYCEFLFVGDLK